MQGQLFTQDFLTRGVKETPPFQALDDAAFNRFKTTLLSIFDGLNSASTINEAQTESQVLHKVLHALGWGDDGLPQVNLSGKRRQDVPDLLLFASPAAKAAALPLKDDQRYRHGLAILEAKRWLRPLDRGDASEAHDPDAPSSQMLRYLSRADVVSDRAVKWGMLTNGAVWRLYWQDARSRAEEFFEVDLSQALGVPGVQHGLDDIAPDHALRLFYVFFQRSAFLPQDWDNTGRSFHAFALNEARLYEEKVSQDLGARVFDDVFPRLADALARGDLHATTHTVGYGQFTRPQFNDDYLEEVRESALVMLYRLLFLFYAEDRNLLPVRDERYAPYSVRRIREDVRDKINQGGTFSSTMPKIWLALQGVFQLIDKGDDDIGMPAYNGGLFDRARAPLLERTNVPDKIMAPIIDALSRRTEDVLRGWINYRDLSVSHLGGIYERLLEYSLVHEVQARDDYKDKPEINRLAAVPASFARKVSGSYYTHDHLVRLVLRESVGLLAREKTADFEAHISKLAKKPAMNPGDWDTLDSKDPASQILELKICDPAMGSGHFLVALVDDLADRILEAITAATLSVNQQPWAAHLAERGQPWQSPVLQRIAAIRASIKKTARHHGWAVTDAQLDDRHIVRRMILKKCIFGVDKNPMAVELAKTALWLHTFTVGAPLSFLDHHLKIGDSLHGERLPTVQRSLQQLGALLLQTEFDRLALAAQAMAQVADLTDVDISEAELSKQLATEALVQLAPLHAVLDFWRALRWLVPGWPVDKISQLPRLLKLPKDAEQARRETAAGQHPEYQGLMRLLDPNHNLVQVLATGHLPGLDAATQAANQLMARARALARRETFFHWWTSFPTVFGAQGRQGFDAVIGNPPWDRIKLQEVEWFAERLPAIAAQPRAADRKRMVAELEKKQAPLWAQYTEATERAEANARVLGNGKLGSGDYPLLGGGDVNLYSLFVERAQTLCAPTGLVALITPSGIAADKGAAPFFRSISSTGRLGALFDFENRKVFFPDVHASFKFCALVFSGFSRRFAQSRCAFFLRHLDELDDPARTLILSADDFVRVNPNTGAAPIFRNQRDADITRQLYESNPVLVRHGKHSETLGQLPDQAVWPVKYVTMFHMTSDSKLFLKATELKKQGWKPAALNRWHKDGQEALPLYVGKMIWHYDHRASSVRELEGNLKVAAGSEPTSLAEHINPGFYPSPQYWIADSALPAGQRRAWALGFRDITNTTNARTMIAAIVPGAMAGNTLPLLIEEAMGAREISLLLSNFNSFAFDFIARQKAQSTHLNWYILEQLPVIAPERFNAHIGGQHIGDFIRQQVLALTYTAHDMAPFARDMGHLDAQGQVLPPFVWNEEDRRSRLASLDALFFHLYGLNPKDAAYILDTFPIVREHDIKQFGHYRTQKDILTQLTAIQAGQLKNP